MRYTAVTSQPDDFMARAQSRRLIRIARSNQMPTLQAEQYTLRQKQLYEPTRKTEIFIVITMYNVSGSSNSLGPRYAHSTRPITATGRRCPVRTDHARCHGEYCPPERTRT